MATRPQRTVKWMVKRGIRNALLSLLVLTPLVGYLGYSLLIEAFAPIDKLPWTHFNGIDPHTEMYVTWETSAQSAAIVDYGTDPGALTSHEENTNVDTLHRVKLTGLTPDTQYYYKAGDPASTQRFDTRTFRTAPTTKPFNVTLFSDNQQMWGTGHYNTIADAIARLPNTAFVTVAGDFGQEGEEAPTWNVAMEYTTRFSGRFPFAPMGGNHDGECCNNLYTRYFGVTTAPSKNAYSFNWSNCQFVMSNISVANTSPNLIYNQDNDAWVNATLEAGQSKDYRILIFHRAVFSSNGDSDDIIARVTPTAEKYNVSLVIYGHEHIYERYWYHNRMYMCLGGGGGLQDFFTSTRETLQVTRMGACFTQLLFDTAGITIRTLSPTNTLLDVVHMTRQGSIVVPDVITPWGGM